MTDRPTGHYTSDPRIDRAITWALTSLAALAFGVGAWFFDDLKDTQKAFASSQKDLATAVGGLRTEVAVLKNQQAAITRIRAQLAGVKVDVRANRDRLVDRWKRGDHVAYAAEVNTRLSKMWDVLSGVRDEQSKRTSNVYRVNQLAKEVAEVDARLKAIEKRTP